MAVCDVWSTNTEPRVCEYVNCDVSARAFDDDIDKPSANTSIDAYQLFSTQLLLVHQPLFAARLHGMGNFDESACWKRMSVERTSKCLNTLYT